MSARAKTRSAPPPAPEARRGRWPVVLTALALLWCAAGYCYGDSWALLYVAASASVVAVARSRPLPLTVRWIVWCGVALLVLCLAANVPRMAPPERTMDGTQGVQRLVTAFFALGLTALFFRSSATGLTAAATGGLPMVMAVLLREPHAPGFLGRWETPFVWGFFVWLAAADVVQRMTQPSDSETRACGRTEWSLRALALLAVLGAAYAVRGPVEWAVKDVQRRVLGWTMSVEREARQDLGDIRLNLPTARNFGRRMRVMLLVEADRLPGYLREHVFLRYGHGRWLAVRPKRELAAWPDPAAKTYPLDSHGALAGTGVWRVEVIAPNQVSGFCLPGSAVAILCDGPPPLAETNGAFAAAERLPSRYDLAVRRRSLLESAYPYPEGSGDPVYLEVPDPLASAVSNWVSRCPTLTASLSARTAVSAVERYFATNFTYRLGVRLASSPDPLVDFMARREGSCTHFASAAALMFRQCGFPSRLVSGYVCEEWSPWLKRWVVRERQGHAWVEVWDATLGCWLVADPTPPTGQPSAWAPASVFRRMLDLVAAGWRRLLGYLSTTRFLEVIADLGALAVSFVWHVVWSVPGAVVLVGGALIAWLRRRVRCRRVTSDERVRGEMTRVMERLARRAAGAYLRRRPAESWDAWIARVAAERTDDRVADVRDLLEAYQALRYQDALDAEAARVWMAHARGSWKTKRSGKR